MQGGEEEEFVSLLFLQPYSSYLTAIQNRLRNIFGFVCFLQRRHVYRPFNTIGESRTVVGGGGIVSAYGIQEVVVRRHTHSSSPLGHGSTHAPLVGVRIEAFHRPQT